METSEKRTAETAELADAEAAAKRPKQSSDFVQQLQAAAEAGSSADDVPVEDDDFDLLVEAGTINEGDDKKEAPSEPPEELARRLFVERLASVERIDGESLSDFIEELQTKAINWGSAKRWRCSALLLVYVARSSRVCRAAFVAEGLPLLGSVLQEGISVLESSDPMADRQEAGMWVMGCLSCLTSLPIGRATMWEHRAVLGKPFDRLHRWCGQQKSAIAAELRSHTNRLCQRWRRQPKPAEQESDAGTKSLRRKVVDMIAQGLNGIAGLNSPASPAPMASPGVHRLPPCTIAAEVEAVLFARYNSVASGEYRQHARMLRSNLALHTNRSLRDGVLSGAVSADELIAMNSNSLAPEGLQEQRLIQQQKALRATIIKEKLKPPKVLKDGHTDYNPATAPPALEKRESSELLSRTNSTYEMSRSSSTNDISMQTETAQPAVPMPPPPTPFRDGLAGMPPPGAASPHHAMEAMATPAPGQEDEDETALIQWLSRPI
jgi:hypothetical protein